MIRQNALELGLDCGPIAGVRKFSADGKQHVVALLPAFLLRVPQDIVEFALQDGLNGLGVLDMLQVVNAESHQGGRGETRSRMASLRLARRAVRVLTGLLLLAAFGLVFLAMAV